jgi:hypothetical protein
MKQPSFCLKRLLRRLICPPGFLPGLLLLSCASTPTRYQISVGNEDPARAIREVQVLADGRVVREFARIGPSKSASLQPRKGAPPEQLRVRWVDAEGARREAEFSPRQDMPADFQGLVFVRITPEGETELQRIVHTRDDQSILPWNVPESWEGSIGIPGMNER